MGGRGASSGLNINQGNKVKISLPQLTGSEKQVRWANEIRENAINTINANIETARKRMREYPSLSKRYSEDIESFSEIGNQLKAVLEKVTSAEQIINKRHIFEGSRIINEAKKLKERKKR